MGGPLVAASAYYMKSPSKQMRDSVARELTDAFIEGMDGTVGGLERVGEAGALNS
jgi:myo-inositol-1-phosphate synthase